MAHYNEIPEHVAIIMDGNGRWAKSHGLPRVEGHRAGAESVREVVDGCIELGVKYLTLYAFSSENWNRPEAEVLALMFLLEHFIKSKLPDLHRQEIRLRAIGNLDRMPAKTRKVLDDAMAETAHYSRLNLVLALSYGSREEILSATKKIAEDVAAGKISLDEINEERFSKSLYTSGMPDPELLIRTSGEMRISNFLLWQISYAEIIILEKFWPDFRQGDLFDAVAEYQKRHRRFGGI